MEIPPMTAMAAVQHVRAKAVAVMVRFNHFLKPVMMATPMLAVLVMPIALVREPVQRAAMATYALRRNFVMMAAPTAVVIATATVRRPG